MGDNRAAQQQVLIDYAFTHSFDESAHLIIEKAAAEVGSENGILVVLEEDESTMHVAATFGELSAPTNPSDLPVTVSESPDANDWVRCFSGITTIFHHGACRSPQWPFYGAESATANNALYIPFMTPVHARAVFALFGRPEPFGQDDADLVEQIGFLPLRIAFEERRLFGLREIRTIYESVADVLFTLSVEPDDIFRFTSVNESFLEATGLSIDEIIGKDFREVIPPESQELVLSNYRTAVAKGRTVRWEEVSEYPAGRRYGEVSVRPVCNEHGRCTHLIGTVHDVSAYRNAVEELRSANEKYRAFFESSIDGILMLSPDGAIFEANPAASKMFGRTQEELLKGGRNILIDVADPKAAALIEMRKTTGRAQGEQMLRRKDGSTFPAEISAAVFHDASDNLRIGMVLRDISERVAAQQEIEQNERYFRALIDNAADIIMVLSAEGEVRYCSPSVKRQLGYEPDELEGGRIGELEMFELDVQALHNLELVTEQAGLALPIALTAATAEGEHRYLSGAARNAVNEATVGGIVVNLRDITAQAKSEREREQLRDELEQARKMESVGRLAGGVAHDFNNQLTVILGHVELMLARVGRGERNYDDLVAIRTAATKSADLTRQLLAFARRQSISPRLIDLNEAVEGMIRMLRRLIGENIELAWEPDRDIGGVKLDPVQIDQVMVNLCLNARDAIDGSGRITITTRRVRLAAEGSDSPEGGAMKDYVQISVSDNGAGMDNETLSRLFEPFFTTKPQGKGTGLGTATVYGIVQQNHGRINVSSEPGRGTTFDLYFPEQHEAIRRADGQKGPFSALGRGETILLVEDDRSILETTSQVLESIGYAVVGIADPLEAIGFVDGHRGDIDLIITDVIMPGMNGRDLVERLATLRPNVKSLYVSGYTADVIGLQGVLDDGVHFLEKPYRFDDLAAKVREILSS